MKNFRSLIFARANYLQFATGQNWPVCLKKSWQIYHLSKALHAGEISFYFEKKSGEIRKARGTLKIDYQFKNEYQPSPKILTYFDLDQRDFRRFKVENFIMFAENKPANRAKIRRKRLNHFNTYIMNYAEKKAKEAAENYEKETPEFKKGVEKQVYVNLRLVEDLNAKEEANELNQDFDDLINYLETHKI